MRVVWLINGKQVARDILAGRATDLYNAFGFAITPEGGDYWWRINDDIRDGKPLSDEARAKLVAMLLIGEEK